MSAESTVGRSPGAATADPAELRRLRSQILVMGGLLLTFASLVGYGLQLPVAPALLDRVIPWLAIGFLTTWVGGVFLGNAMNSPPAGIPPALRGQAGVGLLGTVAGALSAVVVIQRLTPGAMVSTGPLTVAEAALLGAVLAWAGGLLMGRGMRRFVRRRATRPPREPQPGPK